MFSQHKDISAVTMHPLETLFRWLMFCTIITSVNGNANIATFIKQYALVDISKKYEGRQSGGDICNYLMVQTRPTLFNITVKTTSTTQQQLLKTPLQKRQYILQFKKNRMHAKLFYMSIWIIWQLTYYVFCLYNSLSFQSKIKPTFLIKSCGQWS
mgnify:FL=1